MLATVLVFMGIPRLPGTLIRSLPFSLSGAASTVANFAGGVANPSLPAAAGDGVVNFAPNAYPGFSDVVDLRARGHLSDEVAFRVRTPQAALWRAEAFDTFDGTMWTISDRSTVPLEQSDALNAVALPDGVAGDIGPVPTSRDHTDVLHRHPAAERAVRGRRPEQVYFPSGGLQVDRYGSVRSPILLDEGLVYSVVSDVPVTDARTLRLTPPGRSDRERPELRRSCRPSCPPVSASSPHRITAGATTRIRPRRGHANVDSAATPGMTSTFPRDPAGVDSVDHFLFVTRTGFCEQIASSLAIMLRTLGIPTRLVTGYGPGERNPLTGYFEVKQSDAHAWVEVLYPGIGWVPYDPTFGVPDAAPHASSRFIGGEVLAAVGRFLSNAIPESVKGLVRDAGRGIGVVWDGLLGAWPVALVVAALGVVMVMLRRRRRSRTPAQAAALGAYLDLTEVLTPHGHPLVDHATPREYLRRVSADPRIERRVVAEAELVVATLERDRFSGRPLPTPSSTGRARRWSPCGSWSVGDSEPGAVGSRHVPKHQDAPQAGRDRHRRGDPRRRPPVRAEGERVPRTVTQERGGVQRRRRRDRVGVATPPRPRGRSLSAMYPLDPKPQDMRAMGEAVMDHLIGFIQGLDDAPAEATEGGIELARTLRGGPPEIGGDFDELFAQMTEAATKAFEYAGPGYLAYIPGGGLYTAALAEFLAQGLNRFINLWQPTPALSRSSRTWCAGSATSSTIPRRHAGSSRRAAPWRTSPPSSRRATACSARTSGTARTT